MDDRHEAVVLVLMTKPSHRVEQDGRGGYRCSAGDFHADWTRAEHERIRRHVAVEQAGDIMRAIESVESSVSSESRDE